MGMQEIAGMTSGDTVLYQEKSTGYESAEIAALFTPLSLADAQKLRIGDLVWVNEKYLRPDTFGYRLVEVAKIEQNALEFILYFEGGEVSISLKEKGQDVVSEVLNETRLKRLVNENPYAAEPSLGF